MCDVYRNESGCKDFKEFLYHHEDDIAVGMNDFGDLRHVFEIVFNRIPKRDDE